MVFYGGGALLSHAVQEDITEGEEIRRFNEATARRENLQAIARKVSTNDPNASFVGRADLQSYQNSSFMGRSFLANSPLHQI